MRIRARMRRDDALTRRWFAILCGTSIDMRGHYEITRIFFPWFYVDLMFPEPTTEK